MFLSWLMEISGFTTRHRELVAKRETSSQKAWNLFNSVMQPLCRLWTSMQMNSTEFRARRRPKRVVRIVLLGIIKTGTKQWRWSSSVCVGARLKLIMMKRLATIKVVAFTTLVKIDDFLLLTRNKDLNGLQPSCKYNNQPLAFVIVYSN